MIETFFVRAHTNNRIFELANRRFLNELQTKWWNREKRNKDCTEYDEEADEISVENIGGLFILIFIGIAVSFVAIIFEYLWFNYYRKPQIIMAATNRKRIQQYNVIHSLMSEQLQKRNATA